jgi:hypothetical protein
VQGNKTMRLLRARPWVARMPDRIKQGDDERKCANCKGQHEAWNHQCVVRKEEVAKAKAAYATRPRYHPAAQSSMAAAQVPPVGQPLREGARPLAATQSQQNRLGRSRSPTKIVNTGSQRPVRTITPSRRALEALDANSARLHGTHHTDNMDIDRRANDTR